MDPPCRGLPWSGGAAIAIPFVRAVWGRTTELDLVVHGGIQAAVPDGPLDVGALVVDDQDEATGSIAVWIKDGWLSSLEYSWFTDDMPMDYPDSDHLRLWDPHRG